IPLFPPVMTATLFRNRIAPLLVVIRDGSRAPQRVRAWVPTLARALQAGGVVAPSPAVAVPVRIGKSGVPEPQDNPRERGIQRDPHAGRRGWNAPVGPLVAEAEHPPVRRLDHQVLPPDRVAPVDVHPEQAARAGMERRRPAEPLDQTVG